MARLAKDAVSSDDDSSSSSGGNSSAEDVKGKVAIKNKSPKQAKKESHSQTLPIIKQELVSDDEVMKSGSDSESDSGSESESSSSSSSDSESEDGGDEVGVARNDDIQKAIDAKNAQTGNFVQGKAFKAPGSFRKVQSSNPLPSGVSQVFSDPGNKQIWHITAPASVPVSSITQLALDAVATGEPVLTHKGAQYRLREEQLGADTTKHLLLPDRSGTTYTKNPLRVVQTFHLEQVLDQIVQSTETVPSQGLIDKYKKPVRQQPKNMKARNTPIGVKDDDEFANLKPSGRVTGGENDAEMREAHEESKKRKHLETELPLRKKSKVDTDASPDKSSKKEHKSKHREETSEERRARREEKKRRKEKVQQ